MVGGDALLQLPQAELLQALHEKVPALLPGAAGGLWPEIRVRVELIDDIPLHQIPGQALCPLAARLEDGDVRPDQPGQLLRGGLHGGRLGLISGLVPVPGRFDLVLRATSSASSSSHRAR